jgi:hypothetical protein
MPLTIDCIFNRITKKRTPFAGGPVSFFSMPTPALTGSGYKSMISAIVFCNTKVAPLLKKESDEVRKITVPPSFRESSGN